MTMHREFLLAKIDATLALGNYRAILLNATAAFDNNTDPATIISYEAIQSAGGYASQAFTYTAGSATFNATSGFMESPSVQVTFTEAGGGPGIVHTHVALWQGRGATSQLPISSVNATTDRLTVTAHGLSNGARAFVRSTGTIPPGLTIQRYWISVIDANTIELHTNATLTARADITGAGSGTLRLQIADGRLVYAVANSGTIGAGQSKIFSVSYQEQGV